MPDPADQAELAESSAPSEAGHAASTVDLPLPTTVSARTQRRSRWQRIRLRRRAALGQTRAFRRARPWFISMVYHLVLVIVLGLWVIARVNEPPLALWASTDEDLGPPLDDVPIQSPLDTPLPQVVENIPALAPETPRPLAAPFDIELPVAIPSAAPPKQPGDESDLPAGLGPAVRFSEAGQGELGGRAGRRGKATTIGATAASEKAVDRTLAWLARHQRSDGSWSFDHRHTNCRCSQPGSYAQALNGATGLALLTFLGAGQSHFEGKYQSEVAAGLSFLVQNQGAEGSLHEPQGEMYSHGLASLALCEALAIERDRLPDYPRGKQRDNGRLVGLGPAAQAAVYFIEQAQHAAGGWRYSRGEPGDTSVVGWQLMALKSGHLAQLNVDKGKIERTGGFLDSVASGRYGSRYGYVDSSSPRTATTAIGLLCRMVTGWKKGHRGLSEGVQFLSRTGPSPNDMYYNYYATQVMHHYGGITWKRWNKRMRDELVRTQSKRGEESGSWYLPDPFGGNPGGRLYVTTMAAMTLEVYYRHLPIYGEQAVKTE